MGQPVAVVEKKGSRPGLVRFELNRNLTGMGHERFASAADAVGEGPSAELARRLFATGQVDAVHAYLNVVTVDVKKGFTSDGLSGIVEELYTYYRPGVEPPTFDDAAAEEAPAAAASAPADGGDAPKLSAQAAKIPPHLLERARVAKQRWKEKQGG